MSQSPLSGHIGSLIGGIIALKTLFRLLFLVNLGSLKAKVPVGAIQVQSLL